MKLNIKFVKNFCNINNFDFTDEWDISEGSAQSLYLQLVNDHKDQLRYISDASPLELYAVFTSIDTDQEFEKQATLISSDDKSLWKIDLDAEDVPKSGAVTFRLVEDSEETKFKVHQAISITLLDDGGC